MHTFTSNLDIEETLVPVARGNGCFLERSHPVNQAEAAVHENVNMSR